MSIDHVLHAYLGRSEHAPAWKRVRLVGRPLRALAFLLVGAAIAAGGIARIVSRIDGAGWLDPWNWLGGVLVLTGCLVAAIGADEIRRPLRRIGRRTFGKGVRASPQAPWHPRLTAIVDEYRRTTQLNEARTRTPLSTLFSVVNEIISPRLRAQVVFEDAPFRVGGTARVEFGASLEKGFIDGGLAEFRLLCVRESPDVILPWRGGVECLADLEPSKRTDRHAERYAARLEFGIPPGLPASDLTAPRPAYWLFVVIIDRLPGPYREEFFVPVEETGRAQAVSRASASSVPPGV